MQTKKEKKEQPRRLTLSRETIRSLEQSLEQRLLELARGGGGCPGASWLPTQDPANPC
jgi:hypothetical protein